MFTILLGILFTSFQAIEYIEARFRIAENSYGGRFFVTTGFHGLHVIIGSSFLLYCLIFLIKKNISK